MDGIVYTPSGNYKSINNWHNWTLENWYISISQQISTNHLLVTQHSMYYFPLVLWHYDEAITFGDVMIKQSPLEWYSKALIASSEGVFILHVFYHTMLLTKVQGPIQILSRILIFVQSLLGWGNEQLTRYSVCSVQLWGFYALYHANPFCNGADPFTPGPGPHIQSPWSCCQ